MRLTRIREICPDTESRPTLYRTDRGTAVLQGYLVSDPETLSALTLVPGEAAVDIPLSLLAGLTISCAILNPTKHGTGLTTILRDFWLIDGREVVAMHYHPDGQFHGAEVLEPHQVAEHWSAAEVAWESGEDFTTWWNQHPQHHRSAYRVA